MRRSFGMLVLASLLGAFLPDSAQASDPILGEVRLFAGSYCPQGSVPAAGQALFSLLGTTFGGDGTLKFALPDLRGESPTKTLGLRYCIFLVGDYPARP